MDVPIAIMYNPLASTQMVENNFSAQAQNKEDER